MKQRNTPQNNAFTDKVPKKDYRQIKQSIELRISRQYTKNTLWANETFYRITHFQTMYLKQTIDK